jgi:hypothetical protein
VYELVGSAGRVWLQERNAGTSGPGLARGIRADFQEEHRISCQDRIGSGSWERSTGILKCYKDPQYSLAPTAWWFYKGT